MIDYNASAKLNNTTVEKLKAWFKKYTNSGKRIVAICDIGGEVRYLRFCDYTDLCPKCVKRTPEYREKASKKGIERCSNPEVIKSMSEIMKQYHKDHPELGKSHSEWLIQLNKDHPEIGKSHSEWLIQYHKDHPEVGEAHSEWLIQWYIDHPEAVEAARLKSIEQWSHPEACDEMSEIKKQWYIDNPEAGKLHSIKLKNSEAHKIAQETNWENMRGGNDILKHHHIYDHDDLSKYTIEMTRSQHMSLHQNMKFLGLKIPHINTGHENEEELKLMEYIKKIESEQSEPKGL